MQKFSKLTGVNVQIGALPAGYLGMTAGNTIWIDADCRQLRLVYRCHAAR